MLQRREKIAVVLGATLLVLNLLDAVDTVLLVGMGAAREANPLMRELLEVGWGWFLGLKLTAGTAAIAGLTMGVAKVKGAWPVVAMGVLCGLYGMVVVGQMRIWWFLLRLWSTQ